MARRIFSREFKVEAVRLVKERGVAVAQACRQPPREQFDVGEGAGEGPYLGIDPETGVRAGGQASGHHVTDGVLGPPAFALVTSPQLGRDGTHRS